MENNENQNVKINKEKKGITSFLIFIIVVLLIIIGIGAGWYFGKNGDLFNKNNQSETNNAAKIEVSDNTTKTEIVEKTKEMTVDEIYAIYSKNMQNKIKSLGKDIPEELAGNTFFNLKHIHSVEEFPGVGTHINEKLEAYVNIKETGDHIKVLDNAIDCGICPVGNGGNQYIIWAVNTNGDLYTKTYDTLDTANKMNFSLIKKQEFKNIIQVVECSGPSAHYALAIDISGNTYNLY